MSKPKPPVRAARPRLETLEDRSATTALLGDEAKLRAGIGTRVRRGLGRGRHEGRSCAFNALSTAECHGVSFRASGPEIALVAVSALTRIGPSGEQG